MTWEGIRGTIQWMLVLLLAGVAGGAWFVQRSWSHVDEFVDAAAQQKLQEILPDWDVDYARITFDPAGLLTLSDIQLTPKGAQAAAVRIERLQLNLDSTALVSRKVVIRHVTVERPQILLVRFADGRWNWETFSTPGPTGNGSPTWTISNGEVHIRLDAETLGMAREIVCDRIELQGVPEAARRYLVRGECETRGVGRLALQGLIDPGRGEWELSGRLTEVHLNTDLLQLTGDLMPTVSTKLARALPVLHANSRGLAANTPVRVVSNDSDSNSIADSEPNKPEHLKAEITASFRMGQTKRHVPLDYEFNAEIRNGQLSQSIVPIPLYDLKARIQVTPQQVLVDQLSAVNGQVQLFVDGGSLRAGEAWNHKYLIKAASLKIDERIRRYLPTPELIKVYDALRPAGTFDLDVDVEHSSGKAPRFALRRFHAVDCQVLPSQLAYPVSFISGDITQTGDTFQLAMQGMAGERPVNLSGTVQLGTSGGAIDLHIAATDIPMDEQLLNSLQSPAQQGVRRSLEMLRAGGQVDVVLHLFRRPQLDAGLRYACSLKIHDATLSFTGFPYALEHVAGHVLFNPLQQNAWQFSQFSGQHEDAHVTAEGSYDLEQSPGFLSLRLNCVDVPIDHDLQVATVTASPPLQQVWNDYGLTGRMDVEKVEVDWQPGTTPRVSLLGIQWRDGTLHPVVLPYRWENMAGGLDWSDNKLSIHSLQGWHNGTYLQVDGSAHPDAAYIHFPAQDELLWQLHLEDVRLVKLNPDEELRAALPTSLASVLRSLDLQGLVDMQSSCDLRCWDTPEETITASWGLVLFLEGNSFQAGLTFNDVHGRVEMVHGEWDGTQTDIDAAMDFSQLRLLNIPLSRIKGPLRVIGNRVVVGSPTFSDAPPSPASRAALRTNPYSGKQITAAIYTGDLGLDAEIQLDPEDQEKLQYRADVKLSNVDIAEWARDQKVSGRERLRGKANGEVDLSGRGTDPMSTVGEGWLDATPAELYQLPVMAQMFSMLKFRPPDDTAFTYGYCDFHIHKGVCEFSRIKLIGDVLTLAGRGMIGFAGPQQSQVNLDFYSQMENQIALFQPIAELLGDKWIRVQVQGTVSNPSAVILPQIGPLDTALGGILRSLEPPQRR